MLIAFITTNKHKLEEAQLLLQDFEIDIEQVDIPYGEDKEAPIEEVAKNAAKKMATILNRPVIVEDTGIYFEAYNNFPGALPKLMFKSLGYEGLLKLLEGKKREAYFKCVIGFCKPGQEPMIFEGLMKGTITENVEDPDKDVMPYERIFIHEGHDQTMSKLSREEKNNISHRGNAFKKLGGFLKNG